MKTRGRARGLRGPEAGLSEPSPLVGGGETGKWVPGWPCHVLPVSSAGLPARAAMAESSSPPPSPAAAPAAEPGVTEQPGPQSPPPSPPGPEQPLDGGDPEVPHPDLAPVAFFCLRQTTSPRNWCIKMVCNPYPLCVGPGAGEGLCVGPDQGTGASAMGPSPSSLLRRPEAWASAVALWCW